MLTYEKVLDVFRDYLAKDEACEVVKTSRGYTVLVWDECREMWYNVQIAATPENLRDILLESYCSFLEYEITETSGRDDPTEREKQEIQEKRRALLERCR